MRGADAAGEGGIARLGYDPHPELTHWQGTPIPPLDDPLTMSPRRREIAQRVWWNGPAWTVLRNASRYLWHVMDHGFGEDIRFTLSDVERAQWIRALETARPGWLSRGSFVLWSLYFGLMADDESCDWPQDAHLRDVRPLARDTREIMYRRAARYHSARRRGMPGHSPG